MTNSIKCRLITLARSLIASVSPMEARKKLRVPEPGCGTFASMCPAGMPKSDQSVFAHV